YLSVFAKPEHFAAFCPEYANYEEMAQHYRRGGLGDVKVKKFLNEVMQAELRPIREKRQELAKNKDAVLQILHNGVNNAREVASNTLSKVKNAMLLNYFD
ncbi:MAG: tryptophan--tRNA ligase, partial [Alphaproteobacteria bacterium]|nr:tryptophan--tRNA ligase [Alphaproteobacteria bacterium]